MSRGASQESEQEKNHEDAFHVPRIFGEPSVVASKILQGAKLFSYSTKFYRHRRERCRKEKPPE
jgi:hypothetical protein